MSRSSVSRSLTARIFTGLIVRGRYQLRGVIYPRIRRHGPWISLGRNVEVSIQRAGVLRRERGLIVASNSRLYVRGTLSIGQQVFIGRGSNLSVFESVTIGDQVRIAEGVSIHDENHVFEPIPVLSSDRNLYTTRPVSIGARTWIGCNVSILAGVEIGADCVVAAGSVVTGSFPNGVLIAGSPARVVRELKRAEDPAVLRDVKAMTADG